MLDFNTTDQNIRSELEKIAKEASGREALYEKLKSIDYESAQKIHPNNIKRIIRALEIYYVSGETKSELEKKKREEADELTFEPVLLMPKLDRDVLYSRINERVEKMIEDGLIEEVKMLDQKYDRSHNSLQAIGYKEIFPYLDGLYTLDEAKRILKRDTRHYAKRQLTWFRNDPRISLIA